MAYMPWYPLEFNEGIDARILDFEDPRPLTLYVNVPFCQTTCSFCVYAHYLPGSRSLYDDYLDVLAKEVDLLRAAGLGGSAVDCIAIGGGTPNLLSPAQLERLCDVLFEAFDVLPGAEVGMEGRPEFFTAEKLEALNGPPFTRYNCGAQSFSDAWLELIGRNTSSKKQRECFERIRTKGRQEVHMDLLFWMPEQTVAEYESDLRMLLDFEPTYFNAYHLRLIPNTDLHKRALARGLRIKRDRQVEHEMYHLTLALAEAHGYHLFATDLYFTTSGQHRYVNSTWEAPQATILAIGANAMGITPKGHYRNAYDLKAYRNSIERGELPITTGRWFTRDDRMERFMSLGVRRLRIDLGEFSRRFGVTIQEAFPGVLEWLEGEGYVEVQAEHLALTAEGRRYSENISRLFYSPRYRDLSDRHIDVLEGLAVREWNTDEIKRIQSF